MLKFTREDGTEVKIPRVTRWVLTLTILGGLAVLVLAAVGLGALIAVGF